MLLFKDSSTNKVGLPFRLGKIIDCERAGRGDVVFSGGSRGPGIVGRGVSGLDDFQGWEALTVLQVLSCPGKCEPADE